MNKIEQGGLNKIEQRDFPPELGKTTIRAPRAPIRKSPMAAQALWTMASCVEIPQDAPVVRNKEGKKRRPDGQCCEALGPDGEVCGEFFSSSWYAQNRCCAKADCKRYFGVAGVYQPKKAKTNSAPLADRSNEQRSQQHPPLLQ